MGFLNTNPDDDQQIQAAGENGMTQSPTQALPPDTFDELPRALVEGVGAGVADVADAAFDTIDNTVDRVRQYGADVAGVRFNPLAAYSPGQPLVTDVAGQVQPTGWEQDVAHSRQQLERQLEESRKTEGQGSQLAGTVVKGLAEFGLGVAAGGAPGAALAVGGATGDETYHSLRSQGFDDDAASEAAAFQGALAGAGALIPGGFGKLATRVVGGAAVNEALGLASRAGQAGILEANGYDHAARAQRVFDGQQMAVDGILGAGFGLFGAAYEAAVKPSQMDSALAAARDMHAQQSAPGVPVDAQAAALHDELFSNTMESVAAGEPVRLDPDKAEALAAKLVPDTTLAAQQHAAAETYAANPDVQVASEMGPALDEAYARLGEEAAQTGAAPEAVAPTEKADAEGETQASPLSPANEARLRQLEAHYGNDRTFDVGDGERLTFPEVAQRMRDEAANADSDNQAMDAAVACFARVGA